MLIDKTRELDHDKLAPEGDGPAIDKAKVRRCRGMIYWYRWGRHAFDVRVLRGLLALPASHDADLYFMPDNRYHGHADAALVDIVGEIREAMKATGYRSFAGLMKAHDAELAKVGR